MLSVRLRPDLKKRLEAFVQRTHRSKSSCAQQAIEEFLEDQEEYLDALSAVERVKRGEKIYSFEEIKAKYGFKR